MTSDQIATIRSTWNLMGATTDAVAPLFYDRLFAIAPQLRPLFPTGDLSAQAEKLGQWLQVLPDNTLGCLAIRSAPELLQDWQASGYGRLLADPEIQKWLAPLHENGVPIWDLELQKSTGEGLEASLKRLRGSLLLVCAADSLQAFQDTHQRSPFVILLEAGDQRAQLEAEQARLKLSDLRYRNGVASYLDLLDAQRSLFTVEQSTVSVRLAQLLNQIALYKALGGGWSDKTATAAATAQ